MFDGGSRRGYEGRRATFAALVRALTEPSLSEELVKSTVDEIGAFMVVLAPLTQRVLLGLTTTLEFGTRFLSGASFSSLGPDEARLALASWNRGPLRLGIRLLRDLAVVAHYELPEIRESIGYAPEPFITAKKAVRLERWPDDIASHQQLLLAPAPLRLVKTRPPRPQGGIRQGRELLGTPADCDVVIVGSGAGGGVMAAELAEAGLSVMVLEEGDYHPTESFTSSTAGALRSLYREGGATSTIGRPPVGYAEGRCVGGGTVVNGGMAFRASDRILKAWSSVSRDEGLAEGRLDDAYTRVERFLSVGPPDPGSVGRDQDLLRLGADRLGWRVIDDQRNHLHCGGCNVCTWGCPTGAKQSTLVSYLPRAMNFGATVWPGCIVDRILMKGKQAIGVQGRVLVTESADAKSTFEIRAKRVVLCAGAMQTPALLQRSGIRSPSGQIGRNLAVHPGSAVVALFDEPVDGWKGAHQSLQVREFEDEGIVLAAVNLPPALVGRALPFDGEDLAKVMSGYNHMVTAGTLVEDTSTGRVRAVGKTGIIPTYRLNELDGERVARSLFLLSEALLEAGAHTVFLPFVGRAPLHDGDGLRRARAIPIKANDLPLVTVHLMGTARLGTDPLWAVCDPYGSVYDTAGLSVADASLFPAPVGVNPMLTIMALSTRAAGGIIDSW